MASEIMSDQQCFVRTGKITIINSSLSYTDKSNQVVIVQILNVQHDSIWLAGLALCRVRVEAWTQQLMKITYIFYPRKAMFERKKE